MIRYSTTDADLRRELDTAVRKKKKNETWDTLVAKARQKRSSKDDEIENLWSLVKSVYLKLQHGKCGFCERMLGANEKLPYEKDVEHFRPKNRLDAWPPAKAIGEEPWPVDLHASAYHGVGWAKLAHHPWNYLVACKECNQRWKRNFFPSFGKPRFAGVDPRKLRELEQPCLIYPLHDASDPQQSLDDDPQELIAWEGPYALPAVQEPTDPGHKRAKVTIAFFGLNDGANVDRLLLPRAQRLKLMGLLLEKFEAQASDAAANKLWEKEIVPELNPSWPHAACVSALLRLYIADRDAAFRVIKSASSLINDKLPPVPNLPPPPRRGATMNSRSSPRIRKPR